MSTLSRLTCVLSTFISSFSSIKYFITPDNLFIPTTIATILSIVLYKRLFRYRGRKRRLSLFSISMVNSFPKQCRAPDTIINSWCYFKELPTIPDMIQLLTDKVINVYPRMRSRVITEDGFYVWEPIDVVAKDKLYIHHVKNDEEAHYMATKVASIPLLPMSGESPWEFHYIINESQSTPNEPFDTSLLDKDHINPNLDQYIPEGCILTEPKGNAASPTNVLSYNKSGHIIVMRFDHVLGDGVALFGMFAHVTTDKDGKSLFTQYSSPKPVQQKDTERSINDTSIAHSEESINSNIDKQVIDEQENDANADSVTKRQQNSAVQDVDQQKTSVSTVSTTPVEKNTKKPQKSFFDMAWSFARAIINVATLPTGKFDTPMSWNNASAVMHPQNVYARHIVVVPTMSLQLLKDLKNAAHVTINDLLMAITAGAFRRLAVYNEITGDYNKSVQNQYFFVPTSMLSSSSSLTDNFQKLCPGLVSIDDPYAVNITDISAIPDEVPNVADSSSSSILCRALLPFAFPRSYELLDTPDKALSNQFTFLSANTFVNISSFQQRVAAVHTMVNGFKTNPDAFVNFFITKASTNILPTSFAQDAAANLFSRHSLVFSNLPGPQEAYWCGKLVHGMQMVYPNIIPQIGIISMNNKVYMNITMDTQTYQNSHLFGNFFQQELLSACKIYNIPFYDPFM